jgi:nucleoside-diphosphate-sugar epimerase
VKTLKTNTRGTLNMLGLAKRNRGKILLASAGDVYGNAEVCIGMVSWWLLWNTGLSVASADSGTVML